MSIHDAGSDQPERAIPQSPSDRLARASTIGGVHIRGNVGYIQPAIIISGGEIHGSVIGIQTPNPLRTNDNPPISDEQSSDQLELLDAYRSTLHVLLRQQALLGGSVHTTPGVANSIREARDEIRRIKAALRASGQLVLDHPSDDRTA